MAEGAEPLPQDTLTHIPEDSTREAALRMHLLGDAQDGAVGGLVLEVGVIHGVPGVRQRDAHPVRAVLPDRLLQRLEVAWPGAPSIPRSAKRN